MSHENVEVVLGLYQAINRVDLDAVLAGWDPDGEYRAALTQAVEGDAGAYRGHDGLRRWWRDVHDSWEDISIEVLDARAVGNSVHVTFVARGRGIASGVTLEQEQFQVFKLRDGKVIEARDYVNREEALEAEELSE
jgi:ketosteroid isomerase-like protein